MLQVLPFSLGLPVMGLLQSGSTSQTFSNLANPNANAKVVDACERKHFGLPSCGLNIFTTVTASTPPQDKSHTTSLIQCDKGFSEENLATVLSTQFHLQTPHLPFVIPYNTIGTSPLLYAPCTNVNAMLPLQTFYPLPPLTPNELGLLIASHLSWNPHMLLPVLLSLFNAHRRPTSDTTLPNIETEARDTSYEACNGITNGSNVNASTITRTMENGDVKEEQEQEQVEEKVEEKCVQQGQKCRKVCNNSATGEATHALGTATTAIRRSREGGSFRVTSAHTGEKLFVCSVCHHAFADRSNFRTHKNTRTTTQRVRCPCFSRSFIRNRTLIRHLKKCPSSTPATPVSADPASTTPHRHHC
ncbi:unnamed protein product [Hydatigera taeniaeformis]|uniref:C2H2-type domain-containing protein n=1 Tax=Hydatigena taeniaeformis TaxID=6205 RepID=A0A0R3X994_HYDTA|nr:unnamed protein product [Hydatigera taeniaeformis]